MVLISQVTVLNWSEATYLNLEYHSQNTENQHFCNIWAFSHCPETFR